MIFGISCCTFALIDKYAECAQLSRRTGHHAMGSNKNLPLGSLRLSLPALYGATPAPFGRCP